MVWLAGDEVVGVVEGFGDEASDVGVAGGVEVVASVCAEGDEACEAKFGEVLAGAAGGGAGEFGEGSDVAFAVGEQPEQAEPGGFGEHRECCGRSVDLVGVRQFVRSRRRVAGCGRLLATGGVVFTCAHTSI